MAIKLTTTRESAERVKCLVYGESGAGKTFLCQTAPKPVIISAEKGLLTLRDVNIPVIEISSLEDLQDAYEFIMNDKRAAKFETICLDSISDIGETVLAEEKKTCGADPRKAYGSYVDLLLPEIKKFRDIPDRHVYFTAKMTRIKDDFSGITTYGPAMPGQQLGQQLPYLFDFVLALRIGEDEENGKYRFLQTEADIQYIAKARGGRLESVEDPDLSLLFEKALAEDKPVKAKKKTKPVDKSSSDKSSGENEDADDKKEIDISGSFDDEEQEQQADIDSDSDIDLAAEVDEESDGDSDPMVDAAEASILGDE